MATKAKRPVGRPITGRGTDGARLTLRLTRAEHANLERHAKSLDLTPAEAIRVALAAAGITVRLKAC